MKEMRGERGEKMPSKTNKINLTSSFLIQMKQLKGLCPFAIANNTSSYRSTLEEEVRKKRERSDV